jgi:hypothetical protein
MDPKDNAFNMLTADDRTLLRNFNRNIEWLKAKDLKGQPSEQWGSYDEARKILDRSKEWYKGRRLDHINEHRILVKAILVKGEDWRMIGNRVEYKLSSIRNLKEKMSAS